MIRFLFLFLCTITFLFSKDIIGKNEYVILKDFSEKQLKAKVDTGAKTSSLHVSDVRVLDSDTIEIKIDLNDSWKKFTITRIANVKSSNGLSNKRYCINSLIKVGTKLYTVEFTLNDRSAMQFPILLGRNFLENNFLVDVSQEYILDTTKKDF